MWSVRGMGAAALLSSAILAVHAGELAPPGPPAPTPGPEPRTPITALPVTIEESGSYYLAGDLTGVPGGSGIVILTDNVSIDLNGFSLIGVPGSLAAIVASPEGVPSLEGIEIHGGAIRDWDLWGIFSIVTVGTRLRDLRVSNTGFAGISAGHGSLISNCIVQRCDVFAIMALSSSTINSCTAVGSGGVGFSVLSGSVVEGCIAQGNGSNGFSVTDNCVVVNCTASDNGRGGTGMGIDAVERCIIRDCTAVDNADGGIGVSSECLVVGNVSHHNDSDGDGDGAGIFVTGIVNRIEDNHCRGNARGIDILLTGSLVIRNSATDSTGAGAPSANFNLSLAGNTVGPIESGPGTITSTSPWANFEF